MRDNETREGLSLEFAEPDAKSLVCRATPLVFGIFGTIEVGAAGVEENQVLGGGSGILIAPCLGVTARHVARYLYALEDRERPRWPHHALHDDHLFQVLDPFNSAVSGTPVWHVDRTWESPHTDVTLLQVSAESEIAKGRQVEMPDGVFEWHLTLPPIGATVWAIGFPQLCVEPVGRHVEGGAMFTLQGLHVTKVYPLKRDRGMLNFPCFEVDQRVSHGFSGGAVFYDGKLCGIVSSGSNFDPRSHIASLWPLTLMDYTNELGQETRFGDLLDRRVIVADDWLEMRDRISKSEDDARGPYVLIKPSEEQS